LTGYDDVHSDRDYREMQRNVLPPSAGYLSVYRISSTNFSEPENIKRRDLRLLGKNMLQGM